MERVDFGVGAPLEGKYKRIFSTYPDGDLMEIEAKEELCDGRKYKLTFNLRPYESVIFEVPYRESTPEEVKKEKSVRGKIARDFKQVKNDTKHIPQTPDFEPTKTATAKKTTTKKSSK